MKLKTLGLYLCMAVILAMASACGKDATKISDYSQEELRKKSRAALHSLYESTPEAKKLRKHAVAIMVFPDVFRAGFIVGGSGGNGVLLSPDEKAMGYFNVASASFGLQAGAQGFSEIFFLTTKEALEHVQSTNGWSVGVGPTIVVVDAGAAKDLSTMSSRYDVFAFITNQKGLMGGIGVQGQKITKLKPQ